MYITIYNKQSVHTMYTTIHNKQSVQTEPNLVQATPAINHLHTLNASLPAFTPSTKFLLASRSTTNARKSKSGLA